MKRLLVVAVCLCTALSGCGVKKDADVQPPVPVESSAEEQEEQPVQETEPEEAPFEVPQSTVENIRIASTSVYGNTTEVSSDGDTVTIDVYPGEFAKYAAGIKEGKYPEAIKEKWNTVLNDCVNTVNNTLAIYPDYPMHIIFNVRDSKTKEIAATVKDGEVVFNAAE